MLLKINDRIRNQKVDFFNSFNFSLRYDAVGSPFSFGFYFDPDNVNLKELACIGHYHECTLEHNNELLLTGQIISEGFKSSSTRQLVGIGGYSLPGMLEDVTADTSSYPLQCDGLTLREIATKLLTPFKIKFMVDPSVSAQMDIAYEKTSPKPAEKIKGYLSSLCGQRNIILSHNESGYLLFTRAKTKLKPIIDFNIPKGGILATEMALDFNGQAMHSHITVMKQASKNSPNAGQFTIRNPYVIDSVYRPITIIQDSGDDIDTEKAARNALADELRNLSLTIQTDRWESGGKIIKPNNTITVINPDIYLFKKSTWFIEQIDFKGDNKETTATLKCVLPEVYNGETPQYLFRGINLH